MQAEHPFANTHSDRSLFLTEAWRDSLAKLNEGFGRREPFLVVTGDAGTGKTALVLEAAARWEARASVAFLANPALTRAELVEEIARRFGADPPAGASKPQLLACLERTFTEVAGRSQVPVLVIEEAHQLDNELLDELRLLANSEAQAQRPFEVVLVGLPALDARLAEPALESLRQRIAVHCHVKPLSHKETRHYVHHRVRAVGGDGPSLFPRKTCSELHDRSGGVPRTINTLATEAMRRAKEDGSDSVTAEHVLAAATELKIPAPPSEPIVVGKPRPPRPKSAPEATPAAAAPQKPPARPAPASAPSTPAAPKPVSAQPVAAKPAPAPPSVKPAPAPAAPQPAPSPAPVAAQPASQPVAAEAEAQELVTANAAAAVTTAVSTAEAASVESAPPPSVKSAPPEPTPPAPTPDEPASAEPAPPVAEPGSMEALAVNPPSEPDVPSDDPRVRDWVSRFVGDEGPPRVGAMFQALVPSELDASVDHETSTPKPTGRPVKFIPLVEDDPTLAAAMVDAAEAAARGRPPAPRAPARHGWLTGASLAIVVFAITGVVTVLLLTRGEHLLPFWSHASPMAQADSTDKTDGSSASDQDAWSLRSTSSGRPTTSIDPSETTATSPAPDGAAEGSAPAESSQATPPASADDATDQSAPVKPRGKQRLAIEVATFIDAERARLECTRLEAETGLKAWVVTASEYGGQSYRVRLGVFKDSDKAEAMANNLLERGIISESRIVDLPSKRGRRGRH